MIKAVFIDDIINAQSLLEKSPDRYFPNKFKLVEKCNSVDSGVLSIKNHQPGLNFSDIQMPKKMILTIEQIRKFN